MTEDVKGTIQAAAYPLGCFLFFCLCVGAQLWYTDHSRRVDIKAWELNPPTAYLAGEEVDLTKIDLKHYSWSYDEENNVVKLTERTRGCYSHIEYNPD